MFRNKKAIGVVIAVSLLIVVSITAVISFNNWYNRYSSDMFTKTEKNAGLNTISITNVIQNSGKIEIYAKSSNNYEFINNISINGNNCNLIGNDVIDVDLTEIDLDCSATEEIKNKLTLYTNSNIYNYEFFI